MLLSLVTQEHDIRVNALAADGKFGFRQATTGTFRQSRHPVLATIVVLRKVGGGIQMPSEDERRALDEIERALRRDEPLLTGRVGTDRARRRRVVLAVAGLAFLLGMVMLLAGLVTTHALLVVGITVGITGCLIMAITATLFIRHWSSHLR